MKKILSGTLLALGILFLGVTGSQAEAAQTSGTKNLKLNRTYKNYDVTGDGISDQLLITNDSQDEDHYEGMNIFINDKKVYSKDLYYYHANLKLCTLENGQVYLFINPIMENDDSIVNGLFQYQESSGKLKRVVNLNKYYTYSYHCWTDKIKVSGNCILAKNSLMSYTVAGMDLSYITYTYQEGSLVMKDQTVKAKVWNSILDLETYTIDEDAGLITKRVLTTYKKAGGKKKSVKIPKGATVHVDRWYESGKKAYIRIKYGNKKGWIKMVKSEEKSPFTNASYAG